MATSFKAIQKRAAKRKGGEKKLMDILSTPKSKSGLSRLKDDRVLAEMSKCIFRAGFVWKVIHAKWPGFEDAFLKFDPAALAFQGDEFWEELASDTRIVRNGQKIMAVKHNAQFILDIAKEHKSFGRFLNSWPPQEQISLLDFLGKKGKRLGGATGQYFLRFIGYDSFMCSNDMIACLRDSGLEISEKASSKRDRVKIQEQLNIWHDETGLTFTELSQICAMSVGDNYSAQQIDEARSPLHQ